MLFSKRIIVNFNTRVIVQENFGIWLHSLSDDV